MMSEFGITILPDLLANDLDLVIVGTAADAPLPSGDFTTPVRAIGSGACFTKSPSR